MYTLSTRVPLVEKLLLLIASLAFNDLFKSINFKLLSFAFDFSI